MSQQLNGEHQQVRGNPSGASAAMDETNLLDILVQALQIARHDFGGERSNQVPTDTDTLDMVSAITLDSKLHMPTKKSPSDDKSDDRSQPKSKVGAFDTNNVTKLPNHENNANGLVSGMASTKVPGGPSSHETSSGSHFQKPVNIEEKFCSAVGKYLPEIIAKDRVVFLIWLLHKLGMFSNPGFQNEFLVHLIKFDPLSGDPEFTPPPGSEVPVKIDALKLSNGKYMRGFTMYWGFSAAKYPMKIWTDFTESPRCQKIIMPATEVPTVRVEFDPIEKGLLGIGDVPADAEILGIEDTDLSLLEFRAHILSNFCARFWGKFKLAAYPFVGLHPDIFAEERNEGYFDKTSPELRYIHSVDFPEGKYPFEKAGTRNFAGYCHLVPHTFHFHMVWNRDTQSLSFQFCVHDDVENYVVFSEWDTFAGDPVVRV